MLTDADVLEYQHLYEGKFGVLLSLEEARMRAMGLVSLLQLLSQPSNTSHILICTDWETQKDLKRRFTEK